MDDVYIGPGKLDQKGVYAARDFKPGEVVKRYSLKQLTQQEFDSLPSSEQKFVHTFYGLMYLFPEPSRYTNHSPDPNTKSDLEKMCDIASRPIKKGEMITTNATAEYRKEVETYIEATEGREISDFTWIKGGYRNAFVTYRVKGKVNTAHLKRVSGNWHILI